MYNSQFLPHHGNCTLDNGYHTMGMVHFTMVTTPLELYTSQRLPHNGNCTLHSGYHTMVTVHVTIVTTQ